MSANWPVTAALPVAELSPADVMPYPIPLTAVGPWRFGPPKLGFPKRPKPALLIPVAAPPGAPERPLPYAHSPPMLPPPLGPKNAVLPLPSAAERGVSVGDPATSKNTAVRMSVGFIASKVDVLVSVTTRFVPLVSKVTEAARVPLDQLKVNGAALASVGTRAIAITPSARLTIDVCTMVEVSY